MVGKILYLLYLDLDDTYWQDISFSLTEIKRQANKQQTHEATANYNNTLIEKIHGIALELSKERMKRQRLEK
jgi:hypothetical protein